MCQLFADKTSIPVRADSNGVTDIDSTTIGSANATIATRKDVWRVLRTFLKMSLRANGKKH